MVTPEQRTYYILRDHEVDALFDEHLPLKMPDGERWEWNVVADNEAHNDMELAFDDIDGSWSAAWEEDVQAILNGVWPNESRWPDHFTGNCLAILVNRGVLPAGNYLIKISW